MSLAEKYDLLIDYSIIMFEFTSIDSLKCSLYIYSIYIVPWLLCKGCTDAMIDLKVGFM